MKRKMKKLNQVVELITPEIAALYLEYNTNNRPLSKSVVKRYATSMLAGEWELTHQGIAFNVDGILQDGAHRLNAIIESGVPVEMSVSRDMPVSNFSVIDMQSPRTLQQVLALAGYPNSVPLASVTRFVLGYELQGYSAALGSPTAGKSFSNETVLSFVNENYARILQAVNLAELWYKKFPKQLELKIIGGLYWFFSETNPAKAKKFFESFATGAGLDEMSPILKLRDIIIKDSRAKKKMTKNVRLALVIKAWKLYLEGRDVAILKWVKGQEKFPDARAEKPKVEVAKAVVAKVEEETKVPVLA